MVTRKHQVAFVFAVFFVHQNHHTPSFEFSDTPFLGVALNGRLLCYYLLFFSALGLLLALLRIVNSPFGRVLQAIRENEFRAEAIGYRVVVYRTLSSVLSAFFNKLALLRISMNSLFCSVPDRV
jgi:ABC-type branched-subunit amino acid transport system permease subunit